MIQLENIHYSIKGKTLLNDISAEFYPGKINLIIGPNGAGKSTLIRLIAKQLSPDCGQIFYAKQEVGRISIRELARIRGILSQNVELAFPLTVAEVVMLGRYPHFDSKPSQQDREICEETMKLFEVWELSNQDYLTLSGGEKQRTHFARVMAQVYGHDSLRYLLLDEPLNSLDIYYQFDFMEKISQLIKANNLLVIGVIHDLYLAAKYADHLLLLKEGKILACGSTSTVLTNENLKSAYRLDMETRQINGSVHLIF